MKRTVKGAGPAPLLSSELAIEPAWIDFNGHLNMAYYNVLFDRAFDETMLVTGLGPDYVTERRLSYMSVEAHICYLHEVMGTDRMRVAIRILDLDDKRMHAYCEMSHAAEGWLAATSEWMFVHVDMQARKSVPWPADVHEKLEALRVEHAKLPRPERVGRVIGIRRKAAEPHR